jgi:alcohol dehydrogenase, propanol-preferring
LKAVQLVRWQAEPELREVEPPEAPPGGLVLKVEGAGLCHSDLHLQEWPEGTLPWDLPFTLGHETAGAVAAVGEGVTAFEEGDRVLVYGPWGCGVCWHCARGEENLCQRRRFGGCGLGHDGGLAEYVAVPAARLLVPLGDLDPVEAAPLTDAGLTPYHAIKREVWRLVPGSSVVVIGVGGLGHVAVQLLRELSPARVVAVDPRESARRLALDAGVAAAFDSDGLEPSDVRAETGSEGGAVLVLDFVGSEETLRLASAVVAAGGHVSMVGLAGGTLRTGIGVLPIEWSVGKPSWGTLPELHEVVALARAGLLHVGVERLALDETIDGYRRLHRGEVVGRAVVVP